MKRQAISAKDLVAELAADPVVRAQRASENRARIRQEQEIAREMAPILEDLERAGMNVKDGLDQLSDIRGKITREGVGRILDWLPRVRNTTLQEHLVRFLAEAPAPFPGQILTKLFESTTSDALRWAIANTIESARPTQIEEWLENTITDSRWGTAREMLAPALAHLLPPEKANPILISLLDQLPFHAAMAVGASGGWNELAILEERIGRVKGPHRKELLRATRKIRKRLGLPGKSS